MKTVTVTINKTVERAHLGRLIDPKFGLDVDISLLAPYVKSREDIEVLLRYSNLLAPKQPFEVCGYSENSILRRVISLEEDLEEVGTTYLNFVKEHHNIVSFPPEVIWLGRETGIKYLGKAMVNILPNLIGCSNDRARELADDYAQLIRSSVKSYRFWQECVTKKEEKETYLRILMETAIEIGNRLKSSYLAGLVPIIDKKTPGSPVFSHRINEAYAHIINGRENSGKRSPGYLYTLSLNANLFQPDMWNGELDAIIANLQRAFEPGQDLFNGIHISVRWLSKISSSVGRVNVLRKFIRQVNDIALNADVFTWWSRPGLVGLAALDEGTNYSSFQINLNVDDVITDAGGMDEEYRYGKVLNKVKKEIYWRDQVLKTLNGPEKGLPTIDGFKNSPSVEERSNPFKYRINFSKPYNIAAMNSLNRQWLDDVSLGEAIPGREYLQSFEAPYNNWGFG